MVNLACIVIRTHDNKMWLLCESCHRLCFQTLHSPYGQVARMSWARWPVKAECVCVAAAVSGCLASIHHFTICVPISKMFFSAAHILPSCLFFYRSQLLRGKCRVLVSGPSFVRTQLLEMRPQSRERCRIVKNSRNIKRWIMSPHLISLILGPDNPWPNRCSSAV